MQYLHIKSFFSYWILFLQMLHRTNDLIFVDKVFSTNETSSATNILLNETCLFDFTVYAYVHLFYF